MKGLITIDCPGCKVGKYLHKTNKPGFMEKLRVSFRCPDCESLILTTIERGITAEDRAKGLLKLSTKVSQMSDTLRLLKLEEANEKAAEANA